MQSFRRPQFPDRGLHLDAGLWTRQWRSQGQALRSFLDWGLAEKAQAQAAQLGYVPLQGGVLAKARAAVARIVD